MKLIPIVTITLCIFTEIQAQSDSTKLFTLQKCVETGLKNNVLLKQNQLNIETSQVNYFQAKMDRLPSLNGNINYNENYGRSVDPTTYQFVDQRIASNYNALTSSLVIFNGFKINNTIRQNEYNRESAKYNYEDSKNTLILNIVAAYVQVLFNKEILTTTKSQITVSKSQLERTAKLVQAGTLPESNRLDLVSKLASDELSAVNAENQLTIAKLNLLQYINISTEEIDPSSFDIETPIFTFNEKEIEGTTSEVYKTAEKTQPSIKWAQYRIKGTEMGIRVAQSNFYPRLSLNGTIFTQYSSTRKKTTYVFNGTPFPTQINEEYPLASQWADNVSQQIQLQLNIPIFNQFQARSNVQLATISNKSAELDLLNTKNQLRKKIEQAFTDLKSAQKKYDAAKLQIQANEESFRITEKRFNSGVSTTVDYNISSNNLLNAKSQLIQAQYDFLLKSKILDFYKGNELIY